MILVHDFSLPDQNGKLHTLSDYRGKWVILYFYPKDNTPGCTKEACNFRDNIHEFEKRGVVILGVSKDSVDSHKKFADKYKLTFPPLSDESTEMMRTYGAWSEKQFLGRPGVRRITYLINPKGEVAKFYNAVNPLAHSGQILADFDALAV